MQLLLILFPLEFRSEVIFSNRFNVNGVSDDLILGHTYPLLLLFEQALRLVDLPLVLLYQLVRRLLRCVSMRNQANGLTLGFPAILLVHHG